ncbi:hypothetical protein [Rhodoblastus sp.]|uniref:hypothetical protein n=1 Tax=Rhodoblastus sp. TaxID=1962975 RepID=UPI00263685B4|nr:hypothetical protein [Rhodoblastus sp.]
MIREPGMLRKNWARLDRAQPGEPSAAGDGAQPLDHDGQKTPIRDRILRLRRGVNGAY